MKVFIIAALSADGFIGIGEHHNSTSWTTKADLQFFVRRTKQAGTVVMGHNTFAIMNKGLKDRRLFVYTRNPAEITIEGVEGTNEPPAELVARLKREGLPELAVCGGASIYTQFMQAGVVDELYISMMPKLFGQGLSLFTEGFDKNLELLDTEKLDENTVLLHYKLV